MKRIQAAAGEGRRYAIGRRDVGLSNTGPPLEEKLPGVIGDPSALKTMRRGPSELFAQNRLTEREFRKSSQPTGERSQPRRVAGTKKFAPQRKTGAYPPRYRYAAPTPPPPAAPRPAPPGPRST